MSHNCALCGTNTQNKEICTQCEHELLQDEIEICARYLCEGHTCACAQHMYRYGAGNCLCDKSKRKIEKEEHENKRTVRCD